MHAAEDECDAWARWRSIEAQMNVLKHERHTRRASKVHDSRPALTFGGDGCKIGGIFVA